MIGLANFSSIALGLIMIAIVIFEPLGMFGIWIRIKSIGRHGPFEVEEEMEGCLSYS